MLTYIAFFLAISSGSIFCSARFGRKFEEILPITCMGIVLILFVFGVMGILKAGVLAVVLLVVMLYCMSAATLVKKKDWRIFLSAVVTPGAVIFLCAYIAFALLNHGRLAYAWDEFSHWADIVKVMTLLDDFGTNPASHSIYQAYPPGMALFQYFLQKIFLFFNPGALFREALIYMPYQIFFASLLFPFFKGVSFKRPLRILLICAGIFIVPLVFFDTIYATVYIDPFLGFLAGAGFAAVFLDEDRDWVYSLYIWLLCATLILAKDSGMLFALLLAAAYCISIFDGAKRSGESTSRRQQFLLAGVSLLFVLLPKLLWSLELKTSNALIMFTGKVDLVRLLKVLIGRDNTYLSTVFRNWGSALVHRRISLGYTGGEVSYYILFLATALFAFLLYKLFAAKKPQFRRTRGWVVLIMIAEIVIFLFGLCVMYMFKFSEYEATQLASFARYTNTVFLAAWITVGFIALHAIDLAPSRDRKQALEAVLLCVVLAVAPMGNIYSFVRGNTVRESVATRAPYAELSDKIMDVCDGKSTVYFISQENSGFDYWVTRFSVRPNSITALYWSIGDGSFYEGDLWTLTITEEQWQQELVEKYDYVALYRLNDYFYEHYSTLFEDPTQIAENAVYRVDKDTGLLVFCA